MLFSVVLANFHELVGASLLNSCIAHFERELPLCPQHHWFACPVRTVTVMCKSFEQRNWRVEKHINDNTARINTARNVCIDT